MRKGLLILTWLLLLGAKAYADNRSAQLLTALEEKIESLGNYRVNFSIDASASHFEGYYRVAGEAYYIRLGDAEVYCDGRVRYEVDPIRKEVVIDWVDTESRHILGNPTRAFQLLDGEFDHQTHSEVAGVVTLQLLSRQEDSGIERAYLQLDATTGIPRSLSYDWDGERLTVVIDQLMHDSESLPSFDAMAYSEFETIDFR